MNKTRIIWGVLCLVIAVFLEILNLTQPDSMMFYVGDQNVRWVPIVALAVIGIAQLATAGTKGKSWQKREPGQQRFIQRINSLKANQILAA